jgi:hypothetical protein
MKKRVSEVFDYILPKKPGEKPTLLTIGNEFLFWINPQTGIIDEHVNSHAMVNGQPEEAWTENPFSRVFGDTTDALTEIYLLVDAEAKSRGLRFETDFIPIYTHSNNHSVNDRNSAAATLVEKLSLTKQKIGQKLQKNPSDVFLGVGIQCNFFYQDLPSWVTPPPDDIEDFKQVVIAQQQIGPVILWDLNIQGLNQAEKKIKYAEFIKAAIDTKCLGLTFWRVLLNSNKPDEYNANDPYERYPANIFDPFNHYNPIPDNGYEDVTQTLLAAATERDLIG